jgi:hypothetical protein
MAPTARRWRSCLAPPRKVVREGLEIVGEDDDAPAPAARGQIAALNQAAGGFLGAPDPLGHFGNTEESP